MQIDKRVAHAGENNPRTPFTRDARELSMNTKMVWSMMLLCAGWGCRSTPGAEPHDMSTAGHEASASGHEAEATRHEAMYSPEAREARERCRRDPVAVDTSSPCWTSVRNPTEEHRREAEQHRQMAADHRAGSQVLRDAEARACVGISEMDRDMSPFERGADIASVAPLVVRTVTAREVVNRTVGVTVTFRPVPGLTAEWLQRVVNCHLARNAALGHSMPEMPRCPLVPNGVSATVSSTGDGFAVAIQADDPAALEDLQRRAQALSTSLR